MTSPPDPKLRPQFSSELPWLQVAWDSTSMTAFKECPRKYYYSMLESWRSRREAVPLIFGIMYHSCMETYFQAKAEGSTHREATCTAVRKALEMSGARDKDGKWLPWESPDTARSRHTLVRCIVWYLEQFGENDALETVILANGKAAVELSFRMELPFEAPGGEPFLFCGHLDRLVKFGEDNFVADYKSTTAALGGYYFDRYSPDNQMSGYTMASKVVFNVPAKGVIIDAVQSLVTLARFQRGFVYRTQGQIDEWLRDYGLQLKRAREYAELEYWPQNDTACSKFGGCQFRGVCSKDPSVRQMYLKNDFDKVEWNPLTPRGMD